MIAQWRLLKLWYIIMVFGESMYSRVLDIKRQNRVGITRRNREGKVVGLIVLNNCRNEFCFGVSLSKEREKKAYEFMQ